VSLPGAVGYNISFDSRSSIPLNCHENNPAYCGHLKIYRDNSKVSQFGLDDYVGNFANVTVPSSGFLLYLQYPILRKSWGVRMVVTPTYPWSIIIRGQLLNL